MPTLSFKPWLLLMNSVEYLQYKDVLLKGRKTVAKLPLKWFIQFNFLWPFSASEYYSIDQCVEHTKQSMSGLNTYKQTNQKCRLKFQDIQMYMLNVIIFSSVSSVSFLPV